MLTGKATYGAPCIYIHTNTNFPTEKSVSHLKQAYRRKSVCEIANDFVAKNKIVGALVTGSAI